MSDYCDLRESPGPERELPARILVADDSRTNLFLLQEILKGLGYRVATAGNGAEALQEARQSPPDLIVTDILMPVMDGFSLCWEWKRDERLKRIPLICYTGTYTDEREFALELGAERFVVNTGNPEDLIKVIREVLESSKRGGPAAVPPPVAEDTVYLRQHNEILARKLEDKVRQLEQAHRGLQRDIAERKRAEEMQARLVAIVEHSNDAIIGRTLDRTITSWNAAAERMLGYTAAEVIGRDLVEIYPPEVLQQIAERRKLISAGQPVPNYESVRITKDGRRINITLSTSLIRDNSGNIIGTASIVRDITERKRAEETQTRLAAIVEHSNDAIIGRAVDGTITSWNAAAEWLFGYTAAEVVGQNILLIIPPDLQAQSAQRRAQLDSGHAIPLFETERITKDGRRIPVSASQSAIRDEYGVMVGASIIFSDISKRKRAEETKARLVAIVENSNDIIIGRALDSTVTSWNPTAERILGYRAAEVIGRNPVEIIPPELRQEAAEWRNRIKEGQRVQNIDTVRITKDGRRVDVSISGAPIRDDRGNLIGTAAILRDISERKRTEQILRDYTVRLQTVSRKLLEVQEDERRRLARELHDQVGQVLTALKVNLQVIERQPAAAPVALKIEECAQLADAALQQVRTLMLDLRPPQLDELGLAAALRAHAERMVTPANLALHFSAPAVPPQAPPAIEIVCFRIMQEALTNVLRHADARIVWIELAVADDELELTVRDDGKGFDLADAHARAVGGGSIGLLSMEERAALADGRIEISTAPGAGTTVRATFPLQAAQSTVDTA